MAIDDLQYAMLVQELLEEVESAGIMKRSRTKDPDRAPSLTDKNKCACLIKRRLSKKDGKWQRDHPDFRDAPTACYIDDETYDRQHYVLRKHVRMLGLAKKKNNGPGKS